MLSIIYSNFRWGSPRGVQTSGMSGLTVAILPLPPSAGPLCGVQAGEVLADFFAALLYPLVTQPG